MPANCLNTGPECLSNFAHRTIVLARTPFLLTTFNFSLASKNLDNSSPVSARDCRQQEVNGDVSSVIHPSSPDTTTPTTSVSALETDQDKVLAEVVAAAKARKHIVYPFK